MPNYDSYTYVALKQECARRNLGGSGKAKTLIERLTADDNNEQPPAQPAPQTDPAPKQPTFANYDQNGNWVRRPKGFISWHDEETKWKEANGCD
jgi:hypothetical protein